MPERKTLQQARRDRRAGKSPSTQAGAFVREEIERVRDGRHGVRSTRQAIAIGLSKARRAGVDLPEPEASNRPKPTRRKRGGSHSGGKTSTGKAAKRTAGGDAGSRQESQSAVSHRALSRHSRAAAGRRSAAARSASAKKAAQTKGAAGRRAAAKKAARTRAARSRQ